MKSSFFLKTFAGYFFIIILLSVSVLILSFAVIRDHYIDTLAYDLKNLGTTLTSKLTPLMTTRHVTSLDSVVKHLGAQIETRITVIDPEGIVLADSEEDPHLMENHRRRQEIREALEGKIGRSLRFSRTVQNEMLYVALPVRENDQIIGVIRVSLFLSQINDLLNNVKIKIIQIAVIMLIISLVIALFLSKSLSRPINTLVHASRRVAAGDFTPSVLFKRNDELKELADSFNDMISQIKNLVTELSVEKEALTTIIASIQEGILVLDNKGKILMTNESFKNIVGSPQIAGNFYWEIIREPHLDDLVKGIREEKKVMSREIELNGRTFVCSATFLSSAEQVVLTFHDITEILKVARMKKDFVLNISHELRTPLTAIKGFVETLETERDVKEHYLEIIKRHTDRLINIVHDLQTLSALEERERLELEEVYINELVEMILKMFEPTLQEKNLHLVFNIEGGPPIIRADPFKIEQLFINIIDNAIKYTEQGEIRISITNEDAQVKIEIEDTGIGIPEEHLSRIFERFYVVDKSRSRKMGGTGLGLSIVKHIVEAHRGTIEIESEVGQGSKFTIILPK
jgi:two-component system phosphate regulon sensor histidine kinase PhoR